MADLIQSVITATGDGVHSYLGDAAQQKFFVLALTRRAVPYLVLFEDAQMTTIPKNSGGFSTLGSVSFRKVNALWDPLVDGVAVPTALAEGVTPTAKNLSMTEVTTFLKQYGDWIKVSDLSEDVSVDGILTHAAEALGEYEGQKLHRVMLYALDATTNIWYGDGSVAAENLITAGMTLTGATVRKLVRDAKRANMARFPDGNYHMIVESGVYMDLGAQADFLDAAKYNGGIAAGGGMNMITGEIGRGWGVLFKEATELLKGVGASSAVVWHNYLYGPNGYGMLDLATQAVRRIDPRTNRGIAVYSQPVNRPDKIDPLGQLGFVSCKVAFAGFVFDTSQVRKVLTAATL